MIYKPHKDEKLIKFLIHNIQGLSFGSAQKMLRQGKVKVNGKRTKENMDITPKDEIEVFSFSQSKPNIDILYEDDNILIVNKPQGIECTTRDKSSENTYSLEEIFANKNAISIHRLDRLTEGIVILAKSKLIAQKFERYFRTRLINKSYMAYVYGQFNQEGIKTAYLKKDSTKSLVEVSDSLQPNFKEIVTEFKVIKSNEKFSLLDIKLHTGRTHQIRAHLKHLGFPIVNDNKYSDIKYETKYKGYFLTSYKLEFNIDDDLAYLNNLSINISPSWLNETI